MRGTLLNTATVAVGAGIGLALGKIIPEGLMEVALTGLGLVTLGLGMKTFFETKQLMLVAAAITIGGIVGRIMGIEAGLANLADQMKQAFGGAGRFQEGLITATVLFCVGPMTLLGCLQDALERKIELLAIKSLLDGVAAMFLAATLGVGVLASAILVFLIQAGLTLLAKPLKPIADDPEFIREASATGGLMLIATAFGLLNVKSLPTAAFLPALVLAPFAVWLSRKWKQPQVENGQSVG